MSNSTDAPDGGDSPFPDWWGDFENPEDDPEVAALLDFEPVPRKSSPPGAWTPAAQRKYIAWLAVLGAQGKACGLMGKDRGGAKKLYDSPEAGSFREAWHAAIDLHLRRRAEKFGDGPAPASRPPTVDGRWKWPPSPAAFPHGGADGQALNEFGEWEDEESLHRRGEESRDNISRKLRLARRLFLHSIADDPARRAAFEILTNLPVDWDKAAEMQPQADEPWCKPNFRKPDMLLAGEDGWLGEYAHGPDKKAELLRDINEWRAEQGLEPVAWKVDIEE